MSVYRALASACRAIFSVYRAGLSVDRAVSSVYTAHSIVRAYLGVCRCTLKRQARECLQWECTQWECTQWEGTQWEGTQWECTQWVYVGVHSGFM